MVSLIKSFLKHVKSFGLKAMEKSLKSLFQGKGMQ